jgi:hypothetical protein
MKIECWDLIMTLRPELKLGQPCELQIAYSTFGPKETLSEIAFYTRKTERAESSTCANATNRTGPSDPETGRKLALPWR